MEKVVIIESINRFYSHEADEVNKYLSQGWTVKNIHTVVADSYITAIFVLERK